jgi:hypothetical protein
MGEKFPARLSIIADRDRGFLGWRQNTAMVNPKTDPRKARVGTREINENLERRQDAGKIRTL